VVDNNICGTALRFIKGVACNEETLAMEVIKAAGRDAQEYLTSSHTMKWFKKELFFPLTSSTEDPFVRGKEKTVPGSGPKQRSQTGWTSLSRSRFRKTKLKKSCASCNLTPDPKEWMSYLTSEIG
jgi:hypothetical protein